jgi:hypothetical protein
MSCHRAWNNEGRNKKEEVDIREDLPVEDGDGIAARDGPEEQYRCREGY